MAPSPPGWVAAPGGHPTRRALQLLGTFIDEEQQDQVHRWGGFAHEDGERVYWIPIDGSAPRCAQLDLGVIVSYCVAPREKRDAGRMPGPDIALTHLMWIRHDSKGFLEEANEIGSRPLLDEARGERLFEALAHGSKKPAPRRRAPREQRSPLPQRNVRVARAGDLSTRLKAEDLRDFFARHRVEVNAETLRRLGG